MILCPLLPSFFSKFLKHSSFSVILSLFFLFSCPFFLFLLFLSVRALFLCYFFPLRPYLLYIASIYSQYFDGILCLRESLAALTFLLLPDVQWAHKV